MLSVVASAGAGVRTEHDGTTYEGGFEEHHFHGAGVLVKPCGYRYEGSWRCGLSHGRGREVLANGDTYEVRRVHSSAQDLPRPRQCLSLQAYASSGRV